MGLQSLKHRVQKRVEMKKYKQDFSDIGSFIKKKRKELNVTQDEISSGICSISYLSKIENNQIVPSDFYVREIMEKLDIDQTVFATSIQDKRYVNEMIQAIFYCNDEGIKAIYQEIVDIEHNVVINLCKLGYTVYFELDDDNQYVMMLEHVINNMNDLEVELYLYFASLFFVQREKYKTALELVVLYESMPAMDTYLDALFHDLAYQVKHRLHMKTCANDDYHHAMNIYQTHHNVHRMIRLAMGKIVHVGKEHPTKALTMMNTIKLNLLSTREQDQYHYEKARMYVSLAQHNEAIFELKHIEQGSLYYYRKMVLLLELCMMEEDEDMVRHLRQVLADISPDFREMKAKIHYHYLIQETPEDKKEYLRTIAIPFSIKVEDYYTLHHYTKEMMTICINHSRYKEATQFYHKYEREINKIGQIITG